MVWFRGSPSTLEWARENQIHGDESFSGLEEIPEAQRIEGNWAGLDHVQPVLDFKTELPRLPWGSQKALIVALKSNMDELKVEEEANSVQKTLGDAGIDAEVFYVSESDSEEMFRVKLASNHWDIIHFAGHMDSRNGKQYIGNSLELTAEQFVASCCRASPPRLVVLNACQSGNLSSQTDLSGVTGPIAEQFCVRGTDAVVATRWDIMDTAALLFARSFYESLAASTGRILESESYRLDVRDALLQSRRRIKETFPTKDACWLAYTLFESRNDGLLLPSTLVEGNFPPLIYVDRMHHVRNCEHLAPGGAGLYVMPGDFDQGKTTSAKLALRTLDLPDDGHYYSFRHDETQERLKHILHERKDDTRARLQPLVFDDAEVLSNSAFHGTADDIYALSRTAPVLLVVRERYENLGTHISPYHNLGLASDEVITLFPNLLTPVGLAAYLGMFGIDLTDQQADNLFVRTQQRFTGMQAFLERYFEHGAVDLDLLANDASDLESDLFELSGDEILAIQMISSLPGDTPTMVNLRIHLAWAFMLDKGLVESDASIFETLAHRNVLQFYSEPELWPLEEEVDDVYLSRIPNYLRDIWGNLEAPPNLPHPKNEPERLSLKHPELVLLFRGKRVNARLLERIRQIPSHPHLLTARKTALAAFNEIPDCPRMRDGYDENRTLLSIMAADPSGVVPGDMQGTETHLLTLLKLGQNAGGMRLEEALKEHWMPPKSAFIDALESPMRGHILGELSRRCTNFSPGFLHDISQLILNHCGDDFDDFHYANWIYKSVLIGRSSAHPKDWDTDEWKSRFATCRTAMLRLHPERESDLILQEMRYLAQQLLWSCEHKEREDPLLQASASALEIEHDVPYEILQLHHDFGQVMLRHLLERGNARVLLAYGKHVSAMRMTYALPVNPQADPTLDHTQPEHVALWQFLRMMEVLMHHRIALRKEKNVILELRWMRFLLEAGRQMSQLDAELRKGLVSEAISRMFSLSRRKTVSWSKRERGAFARLIREARVIAEEDFDRPERWTTKAMAGALLIPFDPHREVRESSIFDLVASTRSQWGSFLRKWSEFDATYRFPSVPSPDLTKALTYRSLNNTQFDQLLGPENAVGSCKVASLLWEGFSEYDDDLIRPIAKFASTYGDLLSAEERKRVDGIRLG